MMKRYVFFYMIMILLVVASCSIDTQTEYERMEEQGFSSGQRSDSLFLGYYFGMPRQESFDHSWKLNNQRKIYQGQRTASMRYKVDAFKHSAHMIFYPEFKDDKLYKMPVRYMYNGWAPWNRDLWADSLKKDVLNLFQQKYNRPFTQMNHPELEVPAYIAVINNKRIAIFEASDKEVAVNYVDLSVLQGKKDEH